MYTVVISINGGRERRFQSKYCNAKDEAYLHGECVEGEVVRVYKDDELIDSVYFRGVLREGGQWYRSMQ